MNAGTKVLCHHSQAPSCSLKNTLYIPSKLETQNISLAGLADKAKLFYKRGQLMFRLPFLINKIIWLYTIQNLAIAPPKPLYGKAERKCHRSLTIAAGFCILCQLCTSSSNQTVMGQLLDPQEPWDTAFCALTREEVVPWILCLILYKHKVLSWRAQTWKKDN